MLHSDLGRAGFVGSIVKQNWEGQGPDSLSGKFEGAAAKVLIDPQRASRLLDSRVTNANAWLVGCRCIPKVCVLFSESSNMIS